MRFVAADPAARYPAAATWATVAPACGRHPRAGGGDPAADPPQQLPATPAGCTGADPSPGWPQSP